MSDTIVIHSFGDFDRSGKVRWTAEELGYTVEEVRVKFPEQAGEAYRRLNPYAQIPTVELDSEVLIESTSICLVLAERHPEAGLLPADPAVRAAFWQVMGLAATTLEQPAVNYFVSRSGFLPAQWMELLEKPLTERLRTFAASAPAEGYWLGEFSLADILAAYPLRIGMEAGLVAPEGALGAWMGRLRERPAARRARFFSSLEA